jgi:type III secretion system YscI/HrpB-like protein
MTISHVGKFEQLHEKTHSDLDQGLVHEPSQADADLFSSAMKVAGVAAPQTMLPAAFAGALVDQIQTSAKTGEDAKRHMKLAAGDPSDPTQLIEMTRALSEYSQQTALTTKVVSKTTQAFDKLTNMQ